MLNSIKRISSTIKNTRYLREKVHAFPVGELTVQLKVANEIEMYRGQTYESKEPETLAWMNKYLPSSNVFYDVGANVGLYSIYAAMRYRHLKVFSFEPEAQNFARLCQNLRLNGLQNVTPCSFPICDRIQFDRLFVGEFKVGSAFHSFGQVNEHRKVEGPRFSQGMIGVSLVDLVDRFGGPTPDLLKVDVDGIEKKIIDGAAELIRSRKIRSVLVEVNGKGADYGSIRDLFLNSGYFEETRGKVSVNQSGEESCNFVFSAMDSEKVK